VNSGGSIGARAEDGTLTASRITAGIGGIMPPMQANGVSDRFAARNSFLVAGSCYDGD
jgi:hypothetical protein